MGKRRWRDEHVVGGEERAVECDVGWGGEAVHRGVVRCHVDDRVAVRLYTDWVRLQWVGLWRQTYEGNAGKVPEDDHESPP